MSLAQSVIADHIRGQRVGIYSVCCSNEHVLRAAMKVATTHETLLLIEATSNQVDQFGGYTGMTPAQFRDYVYQLADGQCFSRDRIVLGGDHLGPNTWQHMPAHQAMSHASDLIAAYVKAGFHKIHLDCSMACADDELPLSDEIVAQRSAVLAKVAEQTAMASDLPPPVYVIGTEVPIPGGEASLNGGIQVTGPDAAGITLVAHRLTFSAYGLTSAWDRVIAMVVQPGVDFDHSHVHHYDPIAASALSAFVVTQPRIVFEAHSTDYQTEKSLHRLVRDHYAILKVGPAATFAMREGLFALAAIEQELLPLARHSNLVEVLERCMLDEPRHWAKHYAGSEAEQRMLRKYAFSDRSRYYWGHADLQAALKRLVENIDSVVVPIPLLSQYLPEQVEPVLAGELELKALSLVQHKVELVLSRYARACTKNRAEEVPGLGTAKTTNPGQSPD